MSSDAVDWMRLPAAYWTPVAQLLAQSDWAAFARGSRTTRDVCALPNAKPAALVGTWPPPCTPAILDRMRLSKLVCTRQLVAQLPALAARLVARSRTSDAVGDAHEFWRHSLYWQHSRRSVSTSTKACTRAQLTGDVWPPALVRLAVAVECERETAPFDLAALPTTLVDVQVSAIDVGFRGEPEFLSVSRQRSSVCYFWARRNCCCSTVASGRNYGAWDSRACANAYR